MVNMENFNSKAKKVLDSSPLRRRSSVQHRVSSSTLSVNNDEAERLAWRNDAALPASSSIGSDRRQSLGINFVGQLPIAKLNECISECIKLGTENKINRKNAFSLQMIDFMTFLIKKKDDHMTNLKVASTSLDVSTKIYGFRVDGVYIDILQMIEGLDKQDKHKDSQISGMGEDSNNREADKSENLQLKKKQKRKTNTKSIFNTVDALKTHVEIAKPSVTTIEEADSQSTNMLYQAMLPNHGNSRFYHHPYNDVIVDVVQSSTVQNNDVENPVPVIDYDNLEICSLYSSFGFLGWTSDDEPDEEKPNENHESRYTFDIDANMSDDDRPASICMESEQEDVERCDQRYHEVENIVDFHDVVINRPEMRTPEYSFIEKNLNFHWAGPSHWKMNKFQSLHHRNVETCRQTAFHKSKDKDLCYDDNICKALIRKFVPSKGGKIQAKTVKANWHEKILTLSQDKHYDILQSFKLYFHSSITINHENRAEINPTNLSDNIDHHNSDIENSVDHCSGVDNNECEMNGSNNVINGADIGSPDDNMLNTQTPFTGTNLVAAPKLTCKSSIAYSVRQKKVDMKQLKKSIWTCLDLTNKKELQGEESVKRMKKSKCFSEVYKALPTVLSKTNVESLSFPISFVSLLHLANEKSLKINTNTDLSDLYVEED